MLLLYSERADYDDVMYLLNKLIADEEHHIKLIKEAMGVDDSTKKDLILIFKLKAKGLYYKDIAKRLGVSVGTIGRVINKKSYRDENIDRKR